MKMHLPPFRRPVPWPAPSLQSLACAAVTAFAFGTGSCADPVHDLQVKALGSETGNADEYHRAGQPCVTCHGPLGPASTQFSIAGTVFAGPDKTIGVADVEVKFVDSLGYFPAATVKTNCVGNFFVKPSDWDPAFPVLVLIKKGDARAPMQSHIGREPSCSQCHKDPQSFDSPGHIHLAPTEPNTPPPDCPVSAVANLGGGP